MKSEVLKNGKNKSILYIWKGVYPWDVRVEKICRAFNEEGFAVYILSRHSAGLPEREVIDGLNIIRVGKGMKTFYSNPVSQNPVWINAIRRAAEEIKPSLIMPREIMLAEAAGKIGREHRIPVIMDMAEHYPAAMKDWKKYYDNYLKRILVHYMNLPELVEKRAVSLMDGIITVCDEQNDRLRNTYGIDSENMAVVQNTPELSWFKDVEKGCKIPPVNFAYHGFFSQVRNLDILVRGFIIAARQNSNIILTMAGDGENFDEVRSIACNSDIKDRIIFSGSYDHRRIRLLYSEMDIGILPFRNGIFINHTIANKMFDYMACGKPVIVSQSPPAMRVINETKAGIIADCNSAESIAGAILSMENNNLGLFSANGIRAANTKYNWEFDKMKLFNFIYKYIN